MTRGLALVAGWLVATSLAGAAPPEGALALELSLGDLQGDGWRAAGTALAIDSPEAGRAGGHITIERLTLPPPIGDLRWLIARCGDLTYSLVELRCRRASFAPGDDGHGVRSVAGDIRYHLRERTVEFDVTVTHATLGPIEAKGRFADGEWSLAISATGLPLAELQALVPAMTGADTLTLSGEADLHLDVAGVGTAYEANFRGIGRYLALSNSQGTLASDGLTLTYEGTASSASSATGTIDFSLKATAPEGEVYFEPIYVNLTDHPGVIEAAGKVRDQAITLDRLAFSLRDVIDGHSAGPVQVARDSNSPRWHVRELPLAFDPMVLPGAYTVLLQPFLAGTDLAALDTTGELAGDAHIVDNQLREARLVLRDLHAEDRDGRLAIYGLQGEIDRLADGRLQPGWLAFDGGFLYGLAFGTQRADFARFTDGPGWHLAEPIDVPVLDGYLHLERLQLTPPETAGASPTIGLDASLTDIGMRAVASAFGWPPLAGTLSGRIPSVTYENGDIAIAGTLEAEVFSGTIAINGLRIREPFGNRAIARANVQWRKLDLEELSSTFSFGRMNGRVDGFLEDLVLLNWSPLRFDGALYTSPGDRSRHRISQRAVDNIASLGGGPSAAVSSTFLRFFEDFAYDELRLGCRLEDGVCRMSGLEQVTEEDGEVGYLILRGRGLPRLKVVGHADRVDWPRFLAQLRSITEPDGDISVER